MIDRIALSVGYAFMVVCSVFVLVWLWGVLMRDVWQRCLDSKDFYAVVLEYAKKHHKKRVVTDE